MRQGSRYPNAASDTATSEIIQPIVLVGEDYVSKLGVPGFQKSLKITSRCSFSHYLADFNHPGVILAKSNNI